MSLLGQCSSEAAARAKCLLLMRGSEFVLGPDKKKFGERAQCFVLMIESLDLSQNFLIFAHNRLKQLYAHESSRKAQSDLHSFQISRSRSLGSHRRHYQLRSAALHPEVVVGLEP